jgi:AraC-like DNA-binding protein
MTPEPQPTPLSYLGFKLVTPSPALQPFVRSFYYFRSQQPLAARHEEAMNPRGGYAMVFNLGDSLTLDAHPVRDAVFLDGANTVSRKMGFAGQVELIGVRFHEGGAFPFLGLPLSELRDGTGLLDALSASPLSALHGHLHAAQTLPERIALLETWLTRRLATGKPRDAVIPASLRFIQAQSGQLLMPTLSERFGLSQRQLERLYQTQVGMTPKQYARLLRIEAARSALKQLGDRSLTSLAQDLGYYDQPHFIHEFNAVMGITPLAYARRQPAGE